MQQNNRLKFFRNIKTVLNGSYLFLSNSKDKLMTCCFKMVKTGDLRSFLALIWFQNCISSQGAIIGETTNLLFLLSVSAKYF